MTEYSTLELFACVLARDLHLQDRVIQVGTNMPYARAGALLAHLTRLPDARVSLGLSFENAADGRPVPAMNPFLFDPLSLQEGESWMWQDRVFGNLRRPDVFYVGGLQVDRRANVNLQGIRRNGRWTVRGPGVAALPIMSTNCRGYYIVMLRHERRSFVERVDVITALGDRAERARLRLPGGGPRLLLSPLGVFATDEQGEMQVVSLHPGITADTVRDATGWPLHLPPDPPVTPPPTAEELTILRTRIDPDGLLRH